jgi:dTDP-4-dehydrorhamnose reductase
LSNIQFKKTKLNLLIIGRRSFISNILYKFLKNRINLQKISYEKFKICNKNFLKKFTHICNCAITRKYHNEIYSKKNDIDVKIATKIKNLGIKYIFLSSRKVYYPKDNTTEKSYLSPNCDYSKNKLISEKTIKKILPKNHLILRVSNIIGKINKNSSNRKISKTFIDNYYAFKKENKVFYENFYKDFISEKQFGLIFIEILKKNLSGVYNLSLGQKVFISEILFALNKNTKDNRFIKLNPMSNDNFVLNNKKLKKKIKIKITKRDLLKYCYNM